MPVKRVHLKLWAIKQIYNDGTSYLDTSDISSNKSYLQSLASLGSPNFKMKVVQVRVEEVNIKEN